jgi:hypothetical protein
MLLDAALCSIYMADHTRRSTLMPTFKILPDHPKSDRYCVGKISGSLYVRSGSSYVCVVGNGDMVGKEGQFVATSDDIELLPIGTKIEITI